MSERNAGMGEAGTPAAATAAGSSQGATRARNGRAARPLVAEAPLGLRRAETVAAAASSRRGGGRVLASLDASLRRLARPLALAFRDPPSERREPRLRID